ncbi:hypothetical protein PoB_005364400 [Plakobranchus ocellatus]|uniref:Secreted protein n=1 Tax=Plakobranchus ocellatus TaxID=259542 RepID=A0AAV4C3L5_9GAST|nr:hypothetical protein PoB_005364400 [Plakobranchus ocellatus]
MTAAGIIAGLMLGTRSRLLAVMGTLPPWMRTSIDRHSCVVAHHHGVSARSSLVLLKVACRRYGTVPTSIAHTERIEYNICEVIRNEF